MTDAVTDAEKLLTSVSALLRVFHVNERAFPIAEGRIDYSPHVFSTLHFVTDNPGARPSDLGEAFGLRPTTVSSLVARLERQGLIDRRPHPGDKRAKALFLTDEGRDVVAAIRRQDVRNMELMLSALGPDERDSFVDMMGRVAALVESAARA